MSSARSLLARVAKLEQAQTPRPFPIDIEKWEADGEGKCPNDWPIIIQCLRRWKRDGVYDGWQRGSNRVWHR
jgi:hypothetical protein